MPKISVAHWDELEDRHPRHALVADVDLVVIRFDDQVSVLNDFRKKCPDCDLPTLFKRI